VRWVIKAAVQKGLSALPNEEGANYWFQRNVTRNLPSPQAVVELHIAEAMRHLDVFRRKGPGDLGTAGFYEFGAGWDLLVPLIFYALGVERQTLVDLEPHVRFELVEHSWREVNARRTQIEASVGIGTRDLGSEPPRTLQDLSERFGITYLAPWDARDTGLPGGSVDFVSSTYTLEHIPGADIEQILIETRRLLSPEGLVSCAVDMRDHYSFFDPGISVYNFLKFSARTWALANSSLHYQNRLRCSDYLRIFKAAGLDLIETDLERPSPEGLARLHALPLDRRFREGYSVDDLSVMAVHIVASRAETEAP
jgi:SAM-dependent methyltransferase